MPPRRRHRPGGPAPRRPDGPLRSIPADSRASGWLAGPPGPSMPAGTIAKVLIDGRNVQHALARDRGSSLPTAALIARLRAAFSPPTEVELILDGHAGRSPQGKVAPGLSVVFTKGRIADEVIGERVSDSMFAVLNVRVRASLPFRITSAGVLLTSRPVSWTPSLVSRA